MNELKVNSLLNAYVKLQKQEDAIKLEKEALKFSILEELGDQKKYDNGYITATIASKESFKYVDEVAMIKLLKENGYGSYVKEKIDTELNKVLKTDVESLAALKPYYTKSLSESLTVKEKK